MSGDLQGLRGTQDAELERRLAGLSPGKRALYELLLRQEGAAGEGSREEPATAAIPRRTGDGPWVLSSAQERLWFFHRLEPESPSYNVPCLLELTGALAAPALARALGEIVRRHEALRARFVEVDGQPFQIIDPAPAPRLPVVDLSGLPHPQAAAQQLADRAAATPFDLAAGALLRTMLLRLEERRHWLAMVMHHIASDGWSVGVLVAELAALYSAAVAGRPSPLPELALQYPDYAVWQRASLAGGELAEQTRRWRERLANLEVLELPAPRLRPAVQSLRGAAWQLTLPDTAVAGVRALARRQGVTLFMALLAGFDLLLHRLTGQTDLPVGTPVANRRRLETEGLIGFFVNTLVLRSDLAGDPTFGELLGRVREVAVEAYAHQDLPFERLVEILRPDRDVGHTPLFQVMFVLQNTPRPAVRLPGLAVRARETATVASHFDLTLLTAEEGDGGIAATLEYNTDLFDAPSVARLAGHLCTLLGEAAGAPGRRLSEIPLLAAAERQQTLVEWNDSGEQHPAGGTVQELFAAQAERTPLAPAVVGEGETLTYGELARRADLLARRLTRLGIGRGARVGLCVRRSPELVIGILGVLRCGAAWVPLDPEYPAERLAFMAADSLAAALVTAGPPPFPIPPATLLVQLGEAEEAGAAAESVPALPAGDPDDLAYLIYTSGSTGRPKAVLIAQRPLVHHCRVLGRRFRLGPGDRVLQFVSISFDVAVQEILPTLVAGAAVVLRPAELPGAIDDFLRWVAAERLSVLNLPTSYWQEWVAGLADGAAVPPSVRVLIVGTEPALPERWREWCARVGPRVRLINGYGPTEATIESSFYEPRAADAEVAPAVVPIGRPFANTRSYVLDRRGAALPVGVPGELHVAGAGLAWGYFRRPDLTAERFVPDRFGGQAGGRLYRTGDLARLRADGQLECLGRVDTQVKVRGFRVELGEIETALGELARVREAVVTAPQEESGGRRLVAHVVLDRGALEPTAPPTPPITAGELRSALEGRLPAYMIPSTFVLHEALPLSPNGKVDRAALERVQKGAAPSGAPHVPPTGALERTIAEVWREVLEGAAVGIHDNFFDLGGHSLLMVRVQSRLKARAGLAVSLLDMFRFPTVSALARKLGGEGGEKTAPTPRRGRAEQRLAALDQGRQFRATQSRPRGQTRRPTS